MSSRQAGRPETWTRTLILQAVQAWHEETGSVSSVRYAADSLGNPDLPTQSTMLAKGLRWTGVLREIGAEPAGRDGWTRVAEWDRTQVINAVRAWHEATGSVSSVRYSGDAHGNPKLPSVPVAKDRCGPTWADVLQAAGVVQAGEPVPSKWTFETCVEAVRAWHEATGSVSSNDYRAACRGNPDLPSSPTVKTKTGMTWRQLMRYLADGDAVAS